MRWAWIKTIKRGDVVLIRTGWNQLPDPNDPSGHEPDDPVIPVIRFAGVPDVRAGIYLREARWLASHRPAISRGQDGPDRVAIIHPTCFRFLAMP
jgi:hypothetical protein